MTTYQAAQVAGFVAGGALVGLFGARTAICIDAGTFLASAAIVALGVRGRPAPRRSPRDRQAVTVQACWQLPGSCSVGGPSASRCSSGCCRRPTTCRRPSRCRWPGRLAAGRSPPAG